MEILSSGWEWVEVWRWLVIVGWWGVVVGLAVWVGLNWWSGRMGELGSWGSFWMRRGMGWLVVGAIGILVVGLAGIVWPVPEMVVPRLPLFESVVVSREKPLEIRFDRPVNLDIMPTLAPAVSGRWMRGRGYYGPLVDSLWFFPDVELEEGEYQVVIEEVESIVGIREAREYLFTFTVGESGKAAYVEADREVTEKEVMGKMMEDEVVVEERIVEETTLKSDWVLEVPQYYQQQDFTCFAAASRMVLLYRGVDVREMSFWGEMARESVKRNYVTNVWGDPNKGIVGTYDGSGEGGYGAHWGPVAEALGKYVEVEVKRNWDVAGVLNEVGEGNPVMVWWINGVWPAKELHWKSAEGGEIRGANGMHVEVVVGWVGSQENPEYILTNDPWRGRRRYSREQFERLWKWFENTGVVIGERE